MAWCSLKGHAYLNKPDLLVNTRRLKVEYIIFTLFPFLNNEIFTANFLKIFQIF